MKLGFAGSPAFAVEILNRLVLDSRHDVVRILTQPRKPAGRGRAMVDSPIGERARQLGIPYLAPSDAWARRTGVWKDLDSVVVAAYGRIIRSQYLSEPRHGWLNVHPSLLPRWRGATPVEHALLHGDAETGVSIMHVSEELDAGPVYRAVRVPLGPDDSAAELSRRLAGMGADLLVKVLDGLDEGSQPAPDPQPSEGVTYAPRLSASDARIDWTLSSDRVDRKVRAFVGRGGAYTTSGTLRMKVLKASPVSGRFAPGQIAHAGADLVLGCGEGGLLLQSVQLNRGRGKVLHIQAAMNGYPSLFRAGYQFDVEL